MLNQITKIPSIIFSLLWVWVIFVEYWHYNPYYAKAFQNFQYFNLLVIFLLIGAGITWGLKQAQKKRWSLGWINGLSIFAFLLVLDSITLITFYSKTANFNLSTKGLFLHLGQFILVTACVYLVTLVCRIAGHVFTTILPPKIANQDLPIVQIALGIMCVTFAMFFLGIFNLLNPLVLIVLFALILLPNWRKTQQILYESLFQSIPISNRINALGVFSFLFLALFLVFDFVQVLRPFPLGTDSINLYVNLSSLIDQYEGLVAGNQPYNWSLFMSLGLIVFDRVDVVLSLSFLGSFLSLVALYRLSRKWLNVNYAALCLLLYFSVPMINFLSYMDMKIDMGLMFISICILLLLVNWLSPPKINENPSRPHSKIKLFFSNHLPPSLMENRLVVLIGLLTGFAFGIKLTALFIFLGLMVVIWYHKGGIGAFLAAFFLVMGSIFLLQLDAKSQLRELHQNVFFLQWFLLLLGSAIIIYMSLNQKKLFLQLLRLSVILSVFFLIPILPWLGKNFSETQKISVEALLNGKTATPNFNFRNLKRQENINRKSRAEKSPKISNAVREDLHKFMGYESVLPRYLSIPYDVFIGVNLDAFFNDIGFLLLLFFPIAFLFPQRVSRQQSKRQRIGLKIVVMVLCALLLLVSIPNAYLNKHNLNMPQQGLQLLAYSPEAGWIENSSKFINQSALQLYTHLHQWTVALSGEQDAVTYPILLLICGILIIIIVLRIQRHHKRTKGLILFLLTYFFLWWILGLGAAWYGLLIFCVSYIFMIRAMSIQNRKKPMTWSFENISPALVKNMLFLLICSVWLSMAFTLRTANYFPVNEERAKHIYIPPLMEYQTGKLNKQTLLGYHFPQHHEIQKIINREEESLVYRVGTRINYFIKKNDKRVLNDTFMHNFEQLASIFETKQEITQHLKSAGFRYIVLDLNMANNDFTPEKTLSSKFSQLMETLHNNPSIKLILTDRAIQLNSNGKTINGVFADNGIIVNRGTVALFEIK